MGMTRIIKGNTKDITVALFLDANPKLSEVMNEKEIEKAALADMLLARAGSIMLKAPELLQTLDANIKSISVRASKLSATLVKQCEDIQGKFNNYENMRKSLERQLMEYAKNRRAEVQKIIRLMLEGGKDENNIIITREVAKAKLEALNKATEHLRAKVEAISKDFNPIKNSQTKTLEDIFKTIPGSNLAELEKILKPEKNAPKPE